MSKVGRLDADTDLFFGFADCRVEGGLTSIELPRGEGATPR